MFQTYNERLTKIVNSLHIEFNQVGVGCNSMQHAATIGCIPWYPQFPGRRRWSRARHVSLGTTSAGPSRMRVSYKLGHHQWKKYFGNFLTFWDLIPGFWVCQLWYYSTGGSQWPAMNSFLTPEPQRHWRYLAMAAWQDDNPRFKTAEGHGTWCPKDLTARRVFLQMLL